MANPASTRFEQSTSWECPWSLFASRANRRYTLRSHARLDRLPPRASWTKWFLVAPHGLGCAVSMIEAIQHVGLRLALEFPNIDMSWMPHCRQTWNLMTGLSAG